MIDMTRVFAAVSSKKSTAATNMTVVTAAGRRRVRPLLASSSFLQRPPPASLLVPTLPACKMVHGASTITMPVFLGNKNAASYKSCSSFSTAAAATQNHHDDHSQQQHRRTPFLLADIGEGIKEVELLTWFVKTGDYVHEFDKICEVQSDKATVEITSRYNGHVVALAGNVGDMVQVGQPLLYLVKEGGSSNDDGGASFSRSADEDATTSATNNSSSTSTASAATTLKDTKTLPPEFRDDDERLRIPTVASHYHLKSDDDDDYESSGSKGSDGKFAASPAVRKLGKEYKLDLSTIHGSGPRGRLLKSDVLIYLQEQGRRIMSPSSSPPSTAATLSTILPPPPQSSSSMQSPHEQQQQQQQQQQVASDADEYEVVQLKGYNRLMVQSMTKALKIPHMGFGDEIIVDNLMKCRHDLNNDPVMMSENSNKLSLMAFLCKACSLALTEFPLLNAASVGDMEDVEGAETSSPSSASSTANTLHVYKEHRLGIAMDTPRGLVVPVIRNVQKKSIMEIQHDLTRFKELAASNKLSATELAIAPTFTLSNIGALGCGGMTLQPVIVPPQVAMGAMGRIQKVPRYVTSEDDNNSSSKDTLQPVHVMHVTWAGDHRYLDGATLARFHHRFSHYLQQPTRMLLQLK